MKWILASLALALAACPSDDVIDGPDGGDGPVVRGLVVAWSALPAVIPGPLDDDDDDLTLDAATLHLRNVRAIGEVGSDPRTLAPVVELRWATGVAPPELAFPDAPAVLYEFVDFEIESGTGSSAYELTGTVEIDAIVEPFTIRDSLRLAVSIPHQIRLDPGAVARIPVQLDLEDVVGAVDFTLAPVVAGRRVVETGDPQMIVVREKLAAAFDVR